MKRSFFPVLIVLIICVVALGFYRGWFTLSSGSPDKGSHKVDVNLTMDRDKIEEDAETVKKKATEFTGKVTEEAHKLGSQPKASK
jgi:hypothetical protein